MGTYEPPDIFLTVIAATLVVTVLCGLVFAMLGRFRLGNLVRFVPYPVVGGFLAGTGWLLFKGGIYVASGVLPHLRTFDDLLRAARAGPVGPGVRLRCGDAARGPASSNGRS